MASTAKHDWPMVRLGDVCEISIGKTPARKNPEYWGKGHPWLSIRDMNQGRSLSATAEQITDLAVRETSPRLCEPGTVLFSFKLSIGKVGIAQIPLYTNEAIAAFVPLEAKTLLNEYLFHALQYFGSNLEGQRAVMGQTLNKASLSQITIPLPPLDEQRRIAAILDAVAESIAAVKSQLAELSAIPFSMSNQKPQLIALSELVDIRSSQVDPTSEPYLTMPHVAPNNLYSGSAEIVGVKSAAEDGVTSGKYAFKSGDILYSKIRPYLNKVSVAAYDGVCSADMYALVPRDIKQTDWIVWQLRSSRFLAYAAASSGRASIPKINRKTLGAFKVQVADPTVLERFNREQSTKKSLADSMRRKLNLFQELQESLSTRAFQGEL